MKHDMRLGMTRLLVFCVIFAFHVSFSSTVSLRCKECLFVPKGGIDHLAQGCMYVRTVQMSKEISNHFSFNNYSSAFLLNN